MGTGVAIGTFLPAMVLLLTLMLDTGIRSRQDIESVLSVPFLGEVPLAKKKRKRADGILVTETGRDPLTEAFRILRTNINFMARGGKAPQVINLTSFGIGVGKTFTALNLATTLSYLGKKIAVIDLDLRKGTLSSRVGLDNVKGVSHYLSDLEVEVDDILYTKEEIENIDFFPIGVIAPNPVELILSKRLDDFIQILRNRYDYIVVDGVPMGIVADTAIVDRISDLTLFVIRAGKMDRRQLPDIEKIYQEGKLSNFAVVLNGLKLGRSGAGYSSYGYGGYGYGYGYGEQKKRRVLGMF